MLMFADLRVFSVDEDRFSPCRYCAKEIAVLPDDRRGGLCFDCFSSLGPTAAPCAECGREIPAELRAVGCPECGWYALRA